MTGTKFECVLHRVEDELPADLSDDALVGRVAFIWDGHVVTGWPLYPEHADDPSIWEPSDDRFGGRVAGVTHWIEFPVTVWELRNHPAPDDVVREDGNLVEHARTELRRIGEDQDVIDWYLDVIRSFASFGHSGGSAAFTTVVLERLLRFQPLSPLTDDPDEWMDVSGFMADGTQVWQNRRDGRMFSTDGGRTYTSVDDPRRRILRWRLPQRRYRSKAVWKPQPSQ